jgi:outer membrane cobalamin receptor
MSKQPTCPVVAFLLLTSLGGCGTLRPANIGTPVQAGRLITAEQIKNSGAVDAWDALRRKANYLSLRETYSGEPTRLSSRGRSSILLSEIPLVVVDGIRIADFRHLRQIPAATVASIRILNGVEGTAHYGTSGGNGVILVRTKIEIDS